MPKKRKIMEVYAIFSEEWYGVIPGEEDIPVFRSKKQADEYVSSMKIDYRIVERTFSQESPSVFIVYTEQDYGMHRNECPCDEVIFQTQEEANEYEKRCNCRCDILVNEFVVRK
jgi:hypothetical protein